MPKTPTRAPEDGGRETAGESGASAIDLPSFIVCPLPSVLCPSPFVHRLPSALCPLSSVLHPFVRPSSFVLCLPPLCPLQSLVEDALHLAGDVGEEHLGGLLASDGLEHGLVQRVAVLAAGRHDRPLVPRVLEDLVEDGTLLILLHQLPEGRLLVGGIPAHLAPEPG